MPIHSVTVDLGHTSIEIETGKMALLAGGSATVRQGETIIMAAACSADPRPGLDFFPLQVDYREKFSAAGRLPGGYFKREGRPSEKEILTSRMTDRPLRPLFAKGFIDDVQIQSLLLSTDGDNEPDVLSMLGASVALVISDIPFQGPIGALRVGYVDGEYIANPTHAQRKDSTLDLVYAGIPGKTIMIEGDAQEVSEEVLRDACGFADTIVRRQVDAQLELAKVAGKEKYTPKLALVPEVITTAVAEFATEKMQEACQIHAKNDRYARVGEISGEATEALSESLSEEFGAETAGWIKKAMYELETTVIRRLLLDEGKRSDGRAPEDLRDLTSEASVLPRTHGSALFSRGETQALVITTLGSEKGAMDLDGITGGETKRSFYLHYNFPNFSVGETGRIMGPGRRAVGHGSLAERSLAQVIPKDYPYTVRCVSEVMGSNGSTSMASVCGASLSMLDAGVPLKSPVAGISVGLVQEGDREVLLTDILGSEDHHGDMDFKLAGTRDGITAFQLDLKTPGITLELMYTSMQQNKIARDKILDAMDTCLSAPREEISKHAPRMHVLQINPEKIGALIGPGGKIIKGLCETHGVEIDIQDDGKVTIFATNGESMEDGVKGVEEIVSEVEVGAIYDGVVKSIKEFGAFVEVLPGQDGLLHISELANHRVRDVEDILSVGDTVKVKVLDVDERGRMRLSRRALLEGSEESDGGGDREPRRPKPPAVKLEVGKIYEGTVKTIKDFGAFVEVAPGRDGLLHISELADEKVRRVSDIVQVGEVVPVKLLEIDDRDRLRLSRRAALAELGDSSDKFDDDDDDDDEFYDDDY